MVSINGSIARLLLTGILAFAHAIDTRAGPVVPIVDLGYAKYAGSFNATTRHTQFLGIRYAAPPIGALRWQPPRAPSTVAGIQQAHTQPPTCFMTSQGEQSVTPFRKTTVVKRDPFFPSEDCLFLNVYAPGEISSTKKKLPVVIWIHGGGYASGSASGFMGTDAYDGNDLIRESSEGVVVVVIQYRLGVFGFLPGTEVKQNGALNVGLLDQQFAFRWVQKHVSQFGGDPTRVTIWGQSAGAGSVLQHVVAQDGKTKPPLFRAAITSSTFLPSQYQYNDRIPEQIYSEVIIQTNCSSAREPLTCLRGVDVNTLQNVNNNVASSGFFGTFVFVPVVDGTFITQRPTEALKQKKVNGASDTVLTVTNTFEGALFVDSNTASTVQVPTYLSQLFPTFGTKEISAATTQYSGLGPPLFQVTAIMGEAIFICPTYFLLRAFHGRSFKSEFAIPPGGHGNDVSYYYPSQNQNGVPPYNNTAFVKAFAQSFLDFSMSLDPGVKSASTITPHWKVWAGEVEMLFNRTEAGAPDVRPVKTSRALLERCKFWESVGQFSGQ